MTPEDKQLLLKDLCARLPYGVKINIKSVYTRKMENTELTSYHLDGLGYNIEYRNLRPYLRPMSSMTAEEKQSYYKLMDNLHFAERSFYSPDIKDWLDEHHFDYRGLIEKGLALEAPEGMYKTD